MGENVSSTWYWLLGAAALIALLSLVLFESNNGNKEPEDSVCEVTGSVADQDGIAVTDFKITLTPESGKQPVKRLTRKGDKGNFAFSIMPGTFSLSCSAVGYADHKETLKIAPPGVQLRIIMHRP